MTVFPLKYDGTNTLQDMSDTDLLRLTYNLQRQYAIQIRDGGNGNVNVGGSGTTIGTASDTSSTQQTATTVRILNDGIIQTYPAYPGIGSETDQTYTYKQLRTVPSAVASADFNVNGMLYYDSANDEVEPFSTEAQLADVIINQAITNMRTGDEVGSYRVSTSTPSSGGAGTWTDQGTFFSDTTYSAGTTTYKLWVKMSLTAVPGSIVNPVGLDSDGGGTAIGNIHERSISINSRLINNVLLPALTRKMSSGLYYTVSTTQTGENRGAFTDTKQTASTNTQAFVNPNYNSTSTPSGAASTVTTYYLNMIT